jgi:hypothetical protein
MERSEHIERVEPPIGLAGGVCAICLVATFLAGWIVSRFIDVQWVTWFLAVSIPVSVTFMILYRSAWHQELPRITRILSMILSAMIIYIVVLLLVGLAVTLAAAFFGNGMVSS